jgi:hypothetical protein
VPEKLLHNFSGTFNDGYPSKEKMNACSMTIWKSPKRLARIAGLIYLLVAIFAAFAFDFVYTRLYVPGDAAATAGNVAANSGLVGVGIVADISQSVFWVFLALTLYQLLKGINQPAARAMVVLVAIGAGVVCLNTVFEYEGMRVATGSSFAAALGPGGSNALVLLLLDTQHYGLRVAEAFYGLWLLPLGYLAFKSFGMFPRWMGILLLVGGASWLVDFLAGFLVPDIGAQITTVTGEMLPVIAEVSLLGYLLIIGVKPAKQMEVER